MQKLLPKHAENSSILHLNQVFINNLCSTKLINLLGTSSIQYLTITDCTISRNNWNHLITTLAMSSVLTNLAIAHSDIDLVMGKSLARLLIQTKTLKYVSFEKYVMDCSVARLLIEAMLHSIVKNLAIISNNCDVSEFPYSRKRVTIIVT